MSGKWQRVRLDTVCEKIQDGAHHSPKTTFAKPGPNLFPYITSKNIRNGRMDLSRVEYVDATFHQSIYPRCNPAIGDVLLTKDGANTGNVCLNTLDQPISLLSSVCLIKTLSEKLLPKWLMYYIQSAEGFASITGQMTGAAIKRIILRNIKSSKIPLPPLEEQKRIVAILDEAFEGIANATANAERNLANSEELFDSQLQSIFDDQGGAEYELSDVCSIESSLIDPKAAEFANLLHIGGGNIITKSDELIDLRTAKEEGLISGKFLFDRETVLYSKIRPYLMKVSRPDFTGLCSADIYPLKPRKRVLDRDYLYFLLLSKRFTDYAVEGSGRAGMPKVNRKHLFAYRVRLPDLKSQKAAAAKIDSTMNARSQLSKVYRSKLRALSQLRQTLLQKAFSGELTSANEREANVNAVAATTSPQFTADVLAFAYAKHRAAQRDRTFGRVKGQKVLHLVEAVAGVDLGRDPIKDAAGPNDSAHMRRAESWAAQQDYFSFEARGGGGYDFKPGRNFEKTLASAYARLSAQKDEIAKVIDLLVPMDSQEAEVLATVHAAWNNLIIDGVEPTRHAIIAEARENWAASKLEIPITKFEKAIRFIRQNNIIPDGSAKAVRARQESLF
ncbi:restriction endonuclease subunit S [Hyphococcus sp.]|uniref:restriction endonuclease subunit S n=1 Tax=Hyphococcus sp. TaxID=2038636 RepID=UPI003D0C0B8D